MQYRKFGNTDLLISEIGFGAWAIGGGAMIGNTAIGWGDVDDQVSERAIRQAIDNGINFFDTADVYGLGHSEDVLGRSLAGNKNVVIATKGGNVSRDERFTTDYSKKHLIKACEQSLRRLKRDSIDLYQLHSARLTQLQEGECIDAMDELQKKGMIRYWGLSLNTFDPAPEAEFLLHNGMANGFQLVLNIINQKALTLLQKASESGYGIIARMPLQFGLLTGKFDSWSTFAANDHRHKRLTKEIIEKSMLLLGPVWKLCEKYAINKAQLALSYILSHTAVSTVIPGIRTADHVMQNTVGLARLSDEDVQMIEQMGQNELIPLMKLMQQQG